MESIINKIKESISIYKNKTAIQYNENKLSYSEVDELSDHIAFNLSKIIEKDQLVGLNIYKDENFIPIVIALWKIGCGYVPLDKDIDYARINYIIKDSGIKYVISDEENLEINAEIILKNRIIEKTNKEYEKKYIKDNEICYVIYTSGTTGNPKGVMISNNNILNFTQAMPKVIDISYKDRILACTTENFDIAFTELILPLCVGATIILGNKRHLIDMKYLSNSLNKEEITILQATPTTWEMLFNSGWTNPTNVKILCGGEALGQSLAEKMLENSSNAWNLYGPTETTIWSSAWKLKKEKVSIGKPIDNTRFYIIDKYGKIINDENVDGELCISGLGVSLGYINKEDLTKQRFITLNKEIAYKTGDIVSYNNGQYYYKCREDFQIKINGHRIEIEDIEKNIMSIDAIEKVVVIYDKKVKKIKAFIKANREIKAKEIMEILRNKLPLYMIPKQYYFLDDIPLMLNKKIDRKKLLEL